MKRRAIALLAAAIGGTAACSFASEEDQLENSIRASLSNQAEVKQVEITRQDEDNFTGFALIRDRNGRDGRMNCTAQRTEGTNFSWRCLPAIDESVVREMEANIRTELERQARVLEVDLSRQDDNRMTGFARVQDAAGNESRIDCSATRSAEGSSNFNWRCQPGGAAAGGK